MATARTMGRGLAKAKKRVTYLAKEGSRLKDSDAKIIGPAIDRIAQSCGGKATPHAVLDAARAPSSPLHRFFEWNDAKAAEAHRLEQAGHLIRSIEVQYTGKKEDRVRAFHVVRTAESSGYAPIATILSNVDMTKQLVDRALSEQAGWMRRYQSIRHAAEVSGIFDAIETATTPLPMAAE